MKKLNYFEVNRLSSSQLDRLVDSLDKAVGRSTDSRGSTAADVLMSIQTDLEFLEAANEVGSGSCILENSIDKDILEALYGKVRNSYS